MSKINYENIKDDRKLNQKPRLILSTDTMLSYRCVKLSVLLKL